MDKKTKRPVCRFAERFQPAHQPYTEMTFKPLTTRDRWEANLAHERDDEKTNTHNRLTTQWGRSNNDQTVVTSGPVCGCSADLHVRGNALHYEIRLQAGRGRRAAARARAGRPERRGQGEHGADRDTEGDRPRETPADDTRLRQPRRGTARGLRLAVRAAAGASALGNLPAPISATNSST